MGIKTPISGRQEICLPIHTNVHVGTVPAGSAGRCNDLAEPTMVQYGIYESILDSHSSL